MRIDVLSLFPEFIEAFFAQSIIGRARDAGLLTLSVVNPRDFAHNRHGHVDDTLCGGGAGMLMQCGPLEEVSPYKRKKTPPD